MRRIIQYCQGFVKSIAAFAMLVFIVGGVQKANAVMMEMPGPFGEIQLSVDTIISAGVGVRTSNVDGDYTAAQSGGNDFARGLPVFGTPECPNVDPTAPGCRTLIPLGPLGSFGFKNDADKNFSGNQNNDDGRLGFQDAGDVTSATFKVLTDIELVVPTPVGEFTFFSRFSAYYDPVLHSDFGINEYDRGNPSDVGLRELGKDIQVLDFAFSWDTAIPAGSFIGELPVSLKVGKLAANNWGEATFTFTGISQGIILNVPAARRPGAQIKEIIEPEYMVYASIGLPFDIGVDAYYQFHHTPWALSASDSPFGISDTPNPSNNGASRLWLTGANTSGTFRRNCDSQGLIAGAIAPDCAEGDITDYRTKFTTFIGNSGQRAEDIRIANGDLLQAPVAILDADDQGQWGVQLSYYFPYLNGIEFNVSYQNVHSRLPYARIKTNGRPIVTLSIISGADPASTNSLNGLGCTGLGLGFNATTGLVVPLTLDPTGIPLGYLNTGTFVDASLSSDISGTAINTGGLGYAGGVPAGGDTVATVEAANNLQVDLDPVHFGSTPADQERNIRELLKDAETTLSTTAAAATSSLIADFEANGERLTRYDVARINCAIYQAAVNTDTLDFDGPGPAPAVTARQALTGVNSALANLSPIGTEYLSLQYNARMELFYPQNLKIIGLGFNTTLPWLEWGVQGEVTWRPDTPLQQDVTEQLITVASAQGSGASLGDSAGLALGPLVTTSADEAFGQVNADWTYIGSGRQAATLAGVPTTAPVPLAFQATTRAFNPNVFEGVLDGTYDGTGIIEADLLNITIGTTMLYSGSHPIARLLFADQVIILTEFNVIHALDGLPEGWPGSGNITRPNKHSTLACVRFSGTELPLGGLVGLDTISDFGCSPDETSLGYTLFAFANYNNIFGSAWQLSPSIAVRHGVYGNTPLPIPGWREDSLSVRVGLNFSFQNTWVVNTGWVGYFDVGSNDYNVNDDLDTFSFTVSYAF